MKFTIDRSKWICGEHLPTGVPFGLGSHGQGKTELLNQQGMMCCLGHVSLQLGMPESSLLGAARPEDVHADARLDLLVEQRLRGRCLPRRCATSLAEEAIEINDRPDTFSNRESSLISCFANHGHELEFTGNYLS